MVEFREEVYRQLEEKMDDYKDYADIPVIPEEDEVGFVAVRPSAVLSVKPVNDSIVSLPADGIILRSAVADRLYWAGQELKSFDKELQLEVVCGYWSPEVHQKLFDETRSSLAAEYGDEDELLEATHRRIAVSDVAGHPTGGAVDVHILRDGVAVDAGTTIWDFAQDSFTFSPFISREAWQNRQLLRRAMMVAGFAPYDGEWWHFSYGSKEWARFYNQPGALYNQVAAMEVDRRKSTDILS
ncbi:MAG: M15 family metallopeptidase [Pseudonocardiaceae bacterium]